MSCDVNPSKLWRIWAKALGPKSGGNDSEANMVAVIRTIFVLLTIVAEICIIYNVLFIQSGR